MVNFLNTLLTNVKDTWREFQAGPQRQPTRKTKKMDHFKLKAIQKQTNIKKIEPTLSKGQRQVLKVIKSTQSLQVDPLDQKPSWNKVIESAQDRVSRVTSEESQKKVKKNRRFLVTDISKPRKHLLFMGPGTAPILLAIQSLTSGSPMPIWTEHFKEHLSVRNTKLYFDDLRMLTKDEKKTAVKRLYFDPKKPTGIVPIADELRTKFANVSTRDVRTILRSLETYQLNFGRRRPPKVTGKMSLLQPGIISMDMFFPSAQLGWMKTGGCLTCMDCWSRYMHVYVLESKKFDVVLKAMNMFLAEFASYGFLPRRILCDKGTDMAPAKLAMEKFRKIRDGNTKLVLNSVTGGPVNIVEALNAQIQRHMQVFRTSNLTDDPSVIADDISYQINHQKRPDRGNLSPVQLLSLSRDERKQVNDMHVERTFVSASGLKPIEIGQTVRILQMTRKQQVSGMGGKYKGFAPKWSRDTYTVLKRTRLVKNQDEFRYFVDSSRSYYRHELLVIPKIVDNVVPEQYIRHKQNIITVGEDWEQEESDYSD